MPQECAGGRTDLHNCLWPFSLLSHNPAAPRNLASRGHILDPAILWLLFSPYQNFTRGFSRATSCFHLSNERRKNKGFSAAFPDAAKAARVVNTTLLVLPRGAYTHTGYILTFAALSLGSLFFLSLVLKPVSKYR